MGLSTVLRPETWTLELEIGVSEEVMGVDSDDSWIVVGALGETFLTRFSPALLLLFQESGVSNFCPVTTSTLSSWLGLLGLELMRAARASR